MRPWSRAERSRRRRRAERALADPARLGFRLSLPQHPLARSRRPPAWSTASHGLTLRRPRRLRDARPRRTNEPRVRAARRGAVGLARPPVGPVVARAGQRHRVALPQGEPPGRPVPHRPRDPPRLLHRPHLPHGAHKGRELGEELCQAEREGASCLSHLRWSEGPAAVDPERALLWDTVADTVSPAYARRKSTSS